MVKDKKTPIENILLKTYFRIPKIGDTIEGDVFEINKNGLFVDLKNFKTGIVLVKELKENPEHLKQIKIGDKILVKIIELENEDGYVEVSLKEAESERGWKKLEKIMQAKEIIESKVLRANKGGLILDIDGLSAFMPVSQLSSQHYPRVEGGSAQKILQALQELVNKNLQVRIIDLDSKEERLIVSEKATQEKEIEEIIKKYKVGDTVTGTVTGIVDFGAFIKFDNLEGLIHISELAYQLIDNPRDIVKIEEKIKAKIIEIDKNKISLSIKALKKNPWEKIREKYQMDQVVKGKVTKFNPFGAYIGLDKNIHGLAHISEFGTEKRMREILEIGKKYDFKIISIKPKEYRMALKPMFEKPEEAKTAKKTE
jgi:small subunit ribosomal protein S1